MIKLVFCARRRADFTREEFQDYWINNHAPLVRARAKALGAVRYVQNHTIDTELNALLLDSRGMKVEPYDGITEVWWPDMEAFLAAMGEPDAQKAGDELLADEKNFVAFENSCIFLAEDKTVFDYL